MGDYIVGMTVENDKIRPVLWTYTKSSGISSDAWGRSSMANKGVSSCTGNHERMLNKGFPFLSGIRHI